MEGKRLVDIYRDEINMFFQGTLPQRTDDPKKGLIRIVNHGTMETLQVQPLAQDGIGYCGQYEIAVRVPFSKCHMDKDNDWSRDKYQGYTASEGYIWGRNTGGH